MLPANILFVFALDILFGDPEWFPHPVRFIGKVISFLDRLLRRPSLGRAYNLPAGAVTVVIVTAAAYIVTDFAIFLSSRHLGRVAGWGVTLLLGWTCISARSLGIAAYSVMVPLMRADLSSARERLSMIVGRDTADLGETEIARGAVETVAENTSDGVVAPLFYLAIGGPALAMAYKAVNTMDSMIGYRNDRYLWFGKTAARLDDVLNFIPARLTGLLTVLAAWLLSWVVRGYDGHRSWTVLVRDGRNHTSPNSGYPEAAAAGALGVRLGGDNSYFGKKSFKPYIGEPIEPLDAGKVRDAVRLMYATSACAAILCAALSGAIRWVS